MSITITKIHELDNHLGCIALGADGKSERLPNADEWCCESCEDSRYETWTRRIALPATVYTEPTEETK